MSKREAEIVLRHIRHLASAPSAQSASDGQLLERFLARRDEAAFAALLERHGEIVLRVCRRILHDSHEAEDAFQAAFLILARQAGAIRHHSSLASWLYRVAYRIAVRARAGAARREELAARAPQPVAVDPLAEVSGRELLSVLDDELQRLPEKYRAPLVLCYLEGHTQDEAARQLGWSPQTLRGRVERGRTMLRRRLVRRGFGLSVAVVGTLLEQAPAAVPALLTAQTLRTVMGSSFGAATAVTTHIAALAETGIKTVGAAKLKLVVSLVLMLGVLAVGFGAGLSCLRVAEPQTPSSVPAAAPPPAQAKNEPRRDRYGDPLPPGALERFGTVRFRHLSGWLHCLAFSPDGTKLACEDYQGIRLYETASGRPIRHFAERDSLAFLDGGRRILTGGENLIVWDTVKGKEIKRLPIKGRLRHFSMSPDHKVLAGVGSGGELLLVDAATGAVLRHLDGHEDQINKRPKGAAPRKVEIGNVAFSPDGKTLASVCHQDKRVFLWDTATGKVRHTLPGHDKPNVVRFSPDGRLVAVGGEDCIIHLWDAATGRKLQQLRGHVRAIHGLAFSPDSLKLASGDTDEPLDTLSTGNGTIRLWDFKSGKCRSLLGPPRLVSGLAFSPDGKLLAAGGGGTAIYLIDVATGKRQQPYIGHEGRIFRVALSPDGSILASGGEDNLIYLWDVKTSQKIAVLEGHRSHVSGLAFTPDGCELLSCSYDGTVRVWDWRRGKETRRFAKTKTNDPYYAFDLAPDGKTIILPTMPSGARSNASGQLWDVATGRQVGTMPNIQGFQSRLVFSPDGKRVAVPQGAAVVVLDVKTGKEICRFTGHEPRKNDRAVFDSIQVNCVAFALDGRCAVSGGHEGTAFIWDAATGKMLRGLRGHENPILDAAFSPDGRMVATASGDWTNHKERTVRLWEVMTGNERRRFVGHQAQVTSIVFSRDGTTLVSGSDDGTALMWDVRGVLQSKIARNADGESLWRLLASEDVVAAYEAMCALTKRADVAVFSRHLKRVEVPDVGKIQRHVADLDNQDFSTRERAESELSQLEELAESELRKALQKNVSPEVRRRAKTLLAKLEEAPPSAKSLQALRGIEVLEHIATPEARQLIQTLADGFPAARVTHEAKTALDRLTR